MTSSFYVEQLIGEFSAQKCMEHPPKNKGRANVILDPDTYHDRDKMRTLIETGLYFYDPVDNNLICFSFASLSRFGISWKTHTTLKINQMQNLNQSWLESAKCYSFLSKQLAPR